MANGGRLRRKNRVLWAAIIVQAVAFVVFGLLGVITLYHQQVQDAAQSCEDVNKSRVGLVDLAEQFYEAAGSPPDLADEVKRFQRKYAALEC